MSAGHVGPNGEMVPDTGGAITSLTGMLYDNSNSTLNSTNANDAMDELDGKVEQINEDLSDNGETFKFGYNSATDKMGYYKKVNGADTFFPFKSGHDGFMLDTLSRVYGGYANYSSRLLIDSIDLSHSFQGSSSPQSNTKETNFTLDDVTYTWRTEANINGGNSIWVVEKIIRDGVATVIFDSGGYIWAQSYTTPFNL